MREEGFQLCPIEPSRSPEHPKCLADIMVPDCCVDAALFAPDDLKIIPQTPVTYDPSMPHTVARVRSGVGWPGYPTRFCLHTGAYYTCMASGNIAYVVTPEGNARMLSDPGSGSSAWVPTMGQRDVSYSNGLATLSAPQSRGQFSTPSNATQYHVSRAGHRWTYLFPHPSSL